MPSVTFIPVKTNQEKLSLLCRTIQRHFEKEEKILIAVQNEEAAQFIDQLLWKSPPESFLPHSLATAPSQERIVITLSEQNLNKAHVLLNLRMQIPKNLAEFEKIYELYDTTQPDKEQLSLKKTQQYKDLGLTSNCFG